jgi:hypothetical protein
MVGVQVMVFGVFSYLMGAPLVRRVLGHLRRIDDEGRRTQAWLEHHLGGAEPVEVAAVRWNLAGDRILFTLDDGASLRLWCFWSRPVEVRRLSRASFRDGLGWVVDGQAPNGDQVRFVAWRAAHRAQTTPPR